jgi:hypothetical protein
MVKGELQSALADRYTIERELGLGGTATSPIPSIPSCSSPYGRSGTSRGPSGSGDSRRPLRARKECARSTPRPHASASCSSGPSPTRLFKHAADAIRP